MTEPARRDPRQPIEDDAFELRTEAHVVPKRLERRIDSDPNGRVETLVQSYS